MKKLSIYLLALFISLGIIFPNSNVKAEAAISNTEGEIVLDLSDVKVGDKITVFENSETGGKFVIEVLPYSNARLVTGTGSWSGGSIPSNTVTLYPHYNDTNYDYSEIGYYVTYDGAKRKILDVYGETVGILDGQISQPTAKITNATATSTNYARSQMTWTYKSSAGSSLSCYLIQEINYNNQYRLKWRF